MTPRCRRPPVAGAVVLFASGVRKAPPKGLPPGRKRPVKAAPSLLASRHYKSVSSRRPPGERPKKAPVVAFLMIPLSLPSQAWHQQPGMVKEPQASLIGAPCHERLPERKGIREIKGGPWGLTPASCLRNSFFRPALGRLERRPARCLNRSSSSL